MLLTLTDGLLPVKKFDRSFREKVQFKDKWRQKQYISKKWLFYWNFVSKTLMKNFIHWVFLAFVIKISILWNAKNTNN